MDKMKKALALMLVLVLAGKAGLATAATLWDLKDKTNVSKVTISDATGNPRFASVEFNASDLALGTVPDARLSANVTVQGNTFNGVSQLVQTTAAGKYPALDGSLITGVIAAGAPPTGSAGGDLSGTYPNPTVAQLGSISGANLTSLTPANISAGSLPANVIASSVAVGAVLDASIVSVSGSKVSGNISGNAANITGNLAASQVSAGTLSGSFTFSSALTVVGVNFMGGASAATLQTTGCTAHATVPCVVLNTTDYDLYTSTAASAGSWRNSRTGVAP